MATSYTNSCGSGGRTALVVVTLTGGSPSAPPTALIQGSRTDTTFFWGNGRPASSWVLVPAEKIIDEATSHRLPLHARRLEVAGAATTARRDPHRGTFTLGGATTWCRRFAGNTTASGIFTGCSKSAAPHPPARISVEIEFKIDEGGTTPPTSTRRQRKSHRHITVTSSGIS